MKNTLSESGSPYLHQHAEQAVAWQTWTPATHELARQMDRPLFLSIGYATCHWCHVMAHESFDDERVAALLNTYFVPVKVDREERPDVDQFYMTACQASGRRGGWPLTVIALPDGRPFHVSTYLPRDSAPGRAGLLELLQRVALVWKERRSQVEDASDQLHHALKEAQLHVSHADSMNPENNGIVARSMLRALSETFDAADGGFGAAPRFPSWHHIQFLLRSGRRGLDMAIPTLTAMRAGGIWDHIGSGFHRYSTDRQWKLPHFEKMLYDQAWALRTYAEAYALSGEPLFRRTACELSGALQRDFRSEDGLYHAAWDADSEGEEGRYHTWTWDELGCVLGETGRAKLAKVFHLHPEGNYLDEATHNTTGRNLLYTKYIERISSVSDELSLLGEARLLREPPLCDRKRLADWNGLTLSALAMAARYASISDAFDSARRLGHAAWSTFMASGSLIRASYIDSAGQEASDRLGGQLDDYAFLAEGYIRLSEISGACEDMERARILLLEARQRLHDDRSGNWYVSAEQDVPLRMTRYHDEAYPSGASSLLRCMDILDRMYPDDGWSEWAQGLRSRLVTAAKTYPLAFTGTGAVLMETVASRGEMTVWAPENDLLAEAARRLFAPHLLLVTGALRHRSSYTPPSFSSRPHVQICTGTTCQAPIHDSDALKNWVRSVYSDPFTQSAST